MWFTIQLRLVPRFRIAGSIPPPPCMLSRRLQVEASWNVMADAQKPDFIFRRNGRVHLNRRGRQFSRLLAAEVCASAVVMLDTPCSEVVRRVLATHSIRQFPLHFPSRASPCAITFQLPWNRLPWVMKYYSPSGRRNHGRPLKRLLDTWDRNGSTSGPTPWKIYDDDDDVYNLTSTINFLRFISARLPVFSFPVRIASWSVMVLQSSRWFASKLLPERYIWLFLSSFPTIQHSIRVVTSQAAGLAISSFRSVLTDSVPPVCLAASWLRKRMKTPKCR